MHRVMGKRPLDETAFSGPDACEMYANVVRARRFDERARTRQRQGWLSGYRSHGGREAAQAGAAFALADADAVFPTRRTDALQLAVGVSPAALLSMYRGGREPVSVDGPSVFPRTESTGAGLPVAVGAGMAHDDAGDDGVALACLDARTTGEGDFHEACNFAGVFDVPCVFLCENDGREHAPPVAEMATAYGFAGVRVDGTDALAVADAVADAAADTREGRPVLVEAVVDDGERERATGGRNDAPTDPLERLETYLESSAVVDDAFVTETREAAELELDRAVASAEDATTEDADDPFEHAYAALPERLRTQRTNARPFGADEST